MKRVLVVSNNCFSKTNSNGRTLGNLFVTYEKDKLAQFYISGNPDYDYCENYYRVSDEDVLRSVCPLLGRKNKHQNDTSIHKNRTVVKMIIRNVVWNLGFWKKKKFKKWMDNFHPDCVLLQVGDCEFMLKLTLWIVKKYSCELFLYNSEAYYFKDYNYFNDGQNFLFKFFISSYRRTFNKLLKKAKCSVYLNDALKNLYQNKFLYPSCVIYNSSLLSFEHFEDTTQHRPLTFSYIGNLNLGRADSLIEMGKLLHSINPACYIRIFGECDEATIGKFKLTSGVKYNGFINYGDVLKVMQETDVLIHVESFLEFYIKGSKYGFSGKIADSLKSNCAFLIYAPKDVFCVEYFKNNDLKLVASDLNELKDILCMLLNDRDIIKNEVSKQHQIYEKNHNLLNNSNAFIKLINKDN